MDDYGMTCPRPYTQQKIQRLTAASTEASDRADLGRAVAERLRAYPATRGKRITATVHGGLVVLVGDVTRPADRDAAQRAAFCVPGVQDVVNRVRVTRSGARRDEVTD